MNAPHHVVIIGGGFGGLYTAQALKRTPVKVTLIDRRNFHLFQPLLYQVATGGLSPADIASPLRGVLDRQKNAHVILGEVVDLDPQNKKVILRDDEISYDTLIVATGARHSYFGNDQWEDLAPGLKTIEDATEMRRRIMLAFEAAERETDPARQKEWLTFVLVGGGPTGVELAGAVGELAHWTLRRNFRNIDPSSARILLVEGMDRILGTYPPDLSEKAVYYLQQLGVTVQTKSLVTEITPTSVTIKKGEELEKIPTRTVLWAAGVMASPLGKILAEKTGIEVDRIGRIVVNPDLTVSCCPEIFVIGDLALFKHQDGGPLPGVAPVAMQQGKYVAKIVKNRLKEKPAPPPFHYKDKGSMAVIGRDAAIAMIANIKMSGWFAWFVWLFVHLMYIVEFENRLLIFMQWTWNYVTKNRGARLITGQDMISLKEKPIQSPQDTTETKEKGSKPSSQSKVYS